MPPTGVFTKESDAVRALPAARSSVDIERSCGSAARRLDDVTRIRRAMPRRGRS